MAYDPKFVIDNEMLTLVSETAALMERIPDAGTSKHIRLRQEGRIRSIHSSVAIEGNRLSLEKVTDIINGKRVIGDPKDILEVKNAQKAYDRMDEHDPFSINDLLTAHGMMMNGTADSPGEFRDCGVGVYKGGEPIHIAPEHEDVPHLMNELMEWIRDSDTHPLIKGCIFHCRFEYIHPFVDGNGRMGRLWHTLIISRWRHAFSHLPIESWINLRRRDYYDSLTEADNGNITVFIKFMLSMIRMAADEFADEILYEEKSALNIEKQISEMISGRPGITAGGMARLLEVNIRTVKRYLSSMTKKGIIVRVGSDKSGHWEIIRSEADL